MSVHVHSQATNTESGEKAQEPEVQKSSDVMRCDLCQKTPKDHLSSILKE